MNVVPYRHELYAGNIADVFKHCVLSLVMGCWRDETAVASIIDGHAGGGVYRLRPGDKHEQGITRLWRAGADEALPPSYRAAIQDLNPSGELRHYPGSPLILQRLLPARARLSLFELDAQLCQSLTATFAGDERVAVHNADVWQALHAMVADAANCRLVFLDPPYEDSGDFELAAQALHQAQGVRPACSQLLWYTLRGRSQVAALHRAVSAMNVTAQAVELTVYPKAPATAQTGSGMLLLDAPSGAIPVLQSTLPLVADRLAGEDGRAELRFLQMKLEGHRSTRLGKNSPRGG